MLHSALHTLSCKSNFSQECSCCYWQTTNVFPFSTQQLTQDENIDRSIANIQVTVELFDVNVWLAADLIGNDPSNLGMETDNLLRIRLPEPAHDMHRTPSLLLRPLL